MAFWSGKKWRELRDEAFPVCPRDNSSIDDAGYRLSIGDEVYTKADNNSTIQKLFPGQGFKIGPGEFSFILTSEIVKIPLNAIGFISIRASIKFYGLVNVSGFQVNPGYQGKLIFAVFNAGPTYVHLRQGDQIFSLWIADLDAETGEVQNGYDSIPSKLINQLSGQHLTAYQVNEKFSELKEELDNFKLWSFRFRVLMAFIIPIFLYASRPALFELYYFFTRAPNYEASSPREKPDANCKDSSLFEALNPFD